MPENSTSALSMADLITRLQTAAAGGQLSLSDAAAGVGDAADLLDALPVPVVLRQVVVGVEPWGARLAGQAALFDANASVEVEFALATGGPALRALRVAMADDFQFSFPGLPWFALHDVAIRYDRSAGTATSALGGGVRVGDQNIAFQLPLPLPEDEVTLSLASPDGLDLPGLDAVAALLGGGEVLGALKDGMSAARSLGLRTFDITLSAVGISAVNIEFDSDATLDILPGALSLADLGASLKVLAPLDPAGRSWGGALSGSVAVGGVALPLRLARTAGAPVWTLGLANTTSAALPSFGELFDAVGLSADLLPSGLADLAVNLEDLHADLDPFTGDVWSLNLAFNTSASWGLLGLTVDALSAKLAVRLPLSPARVVSGRIQGRLAFSGMNFALEATRDGLAGWTFAAVMAPNQTLSLPAVVDALSPVALSLPTDVATLCIDEAELELNPSTGRIRFFGRLDGDWTLPVGPSGVVLNGLMARVERAQAGAPLTTTLRGVAVLGGVPVTLTANLADSSWTFEGQVASLPLSPLLQALCDSSALVGLSPPGDLLDLTLSDVTVRISSGRVSIRAHSGAFPVLALEIARSAAGEWGVRLAMVAEGHASPSAIASELAVLDNLDLSGTTLVIASDADNSASLDDIPACSGVTLSKGVVLLAQLGLSATGVSQILGINSLAVRAMLAGGDSFDLAAAIGGSVRLSGSVLLRDTTFGMQVRPGSAAVQLATSVVVEIQQPPLIFVGAMSLGPTGGAFSATMAGVWREPFGLASTTVANLALELGVNTAAIPTVGLAGSLKIGDETGALAVKFDSTNPSRSMLAVSFSRLRPLSVLVQLCDAAVDGAIPSAVRELADQISLVDCELYVVPSPTSIGAITYEAGTRIQGGLEMFGFRGRASAEVRPTGGLRIRGSMDPIHIYNVLHITAASGDGGPSVEVDLTPTGRPGGRFSGKATLLGWSQNVEIETTASRRTTRLASSTPLANYALDLVSTDSSLSARGTVSWRVNADIGPFRFRVRILPSVDLAIGPVSTGARIPELGFEEIEIPNIHLDFAFSGALDIDVSATRQSLSLSGAVEWEGTRLSMPDLSLSVVPSDLERLPSLLVTHIQDHAQEIFASLFDHAGDLAMLALHAVEGLAREAFGAAAVFAAELGAEAAQLAYRAAEAVSQAAAEVARVGQAAAAAVVDLGKQAAAVAQQAAAAVAQTASVAAAAVASVANAAAAEVSRISAEAGKAVEAAALAVAQIAAQAAAEIKQILADARAAAESVVFAAQAAAQALLDEAARTLHRADELAHEAQDIVTDFTDEMSRDEGFNQRAIAHKGAALGRLALATGGVVVNGMVLVNGAIVSGLTAAGEPIANGIAYAAGHALGPAQAAVNLVPRLPGVPNPLGGSDISFDPRDW